MTLSEVRSEARFSLKGHWLKATLSFIVYFIITSLICFLLTFIPFIGPIMNFVISVPLSIGLISIFLNIAKRENYNYWDFLKVTMRFFGRAWGLIFSTILKMWKPVLLLVISIVILIVNISFMTSSSILSAAQSASDKYYASQYGLDSVTPNLSTKNSISYGPLLSLLSAVLMIVSVIWIFVKGLLYSLTNYILLDNPNMNNKSILEKSEFLMNGNRLKLILLPLSFIGWILLIYAIVSLTLPVLISLIGYLGGLIIAYIILLTSFLLLSIYIQVSTACFYTKLLNEK